MAEFLIYNMEHWMDSLTQEQIDEYILLYPNFEEQYTARYQKEDLIECQSNGFWVGGNTKGFNTSKFKVVVDIGCSLEDGLEYIKANWDGEILKKRRRWYIDKDKVEYNENMIGYTNNINSIVKDKIQERLS